MAKKEVLFKVPKSNSNSLEDAIEKGLLVLSFVGEQESFECRVCQRGMVGSIPAQAHLNGTPHLKALQSSSVMSHLGDPRFILPPNDFIRTPSSRYQLTSSPKQKSTVHSHKHHSDDNDVESALRRGIVIEETVSCQKVFTCIVCKISCTGNIPMKQHLSGESHCRKQSSFHRRNTTSQASRPSENHSLSECSTNSASLPPVSVRESYHSTISELDGASPNKDLDQSVFVEGAMAHGEGDDSGDLSFEDYLLSFNGPTHVQQQQSAFHKMSCELRTEPEELHRVQHENERVSVTGKATKRKIQPVNKERMINNESGEVESKSTTTMTDLTALLHNKDNSEETQKILCILRDLKESVDELQENRNEVITKNFDESLSSVENAASQDFATLNSEISRLTAKCAVQDHKIADLEEQIKSQNDEINHIRNLNTIKDNKISNLLMQIKQVFD